MKHRFMMLDYPSLSAVAAVVREGSFERAAASLAMTPSAVSQRVRGLEERLGSILVVRGQPCRPTDLGQRLCAHLDRVRLLETEILPLMDGGDESATSSVPLKVAVNADSLATWFPAAAIEFGRGSGLSLDLTLDDETLTADRLRSGEVLAVVTADPTPVQGCRTLALGGLAYAACASPDFVARFFGDGIDADRLARAPHLRFGKRDMLQARWASGAHDATLPGPAHRVPSTHGFLDLALGGLGWGMQPLILAEPHLHDGLLVELAPRRRIDVQLYWTAARLPVTALARLTETVLAAGTRSLSR